MLETMKPLATKTIIQYDLRGPHQDGQSIKLVMLR